MSLEFNAQGAFMGSVQQWCSTAIAGGGWTVALGLNLPVLATGIAPSPDVEGAIAPLPSSRVVASPELLQLPEQSTLPRQTTAYSVRSALDAEVALKEVGIDSPALDDRAPTLPPDDASRSLTDIEADLNATLSISQDVPFLTPSSPTFAVSEHWEELETDGTIQPTPSSQPIPLAQVPPQPQAPPAFETPDSNDDRFLQPGEATPNPLQPDAEDALEEPTAPIFDDLVQPTPGDIRVDTLTISGSSILSDAELNALKQPFLGQLVSEESLQRLADRITERYLEGGYITSRAVLDAASFTTRQIKVQVLEGGIEKIEVEGVQHLRKSYVRDRIALGANTPLNTAKLEDQLRLLRSSPLIDNIEASLRAGTQIAKSILVVRVTEAERFRASTSVDNYSPPSVGSERMSLSAGFQNPTGLGDDVSVGFRRTTVGGSDTLDLTYRLPLNAMDGTLQLRSSFNRNNVVQEPFSVLDIRGNSELYEVSFRQPLQRTPREEFAVSTGLTYQTGQTFTFVGGTPFGFGPETDGTTTTTVLKLGQDYIRRDPRGAWALRSQFSVGLDLFNSTINSGATPDSRFVSWLGQLQRVQVLNENNVLIFSTDLQFASEPLLSSQQFVIGGGQSVRGFRQNVRAGDGGLRFSVEDRITLSRDEAGRPEFIVVPFLDMGWVWYDADNPNKPTDQQSYIAGTGVGFIWSPFENTTLRLDYALPLVNLSDRSQNAQDGGIHFSVNIQI